MVRSLGILVFSFLTLSVFAQNQEPDFSSPDSLYREDQFYIGLSYSNMQSTPKGFDQIKLSSNVVFGFLRDMPFNKARTWAIAPGLGYRISTISHNLAMTESPTGNQYAILTTEFDKNKLALHYLELPLEIRWRASTPDSHKFWRIYTGFKLSYLVYDRNKLQAFDQTIKLSGNADLNKLQYGAYITAGWNTWNAYIYYGINPLYKSPPIGEEQLKLNALNVGLMFYIL